MVWSTDEDVSTSYIPHSMSTNQLQYGSEIGYDLIPSIR